MSHEEKSNFRSVADLLNTHDFPISPVKPQELQDTETIIPPEKPLYQANPKYLNPIADIYEKSRFQKLYGHEEAPEEMLPNSFFEEITHIRQKYPKTRFTVVATRFELNDLHEKIPGRGAFMDSITHLLLYPLRIEMDHRHSDRMTVKILCAGESLMLVARTLANAHACHIYSKHLANFGFYDKSPLLHNKLAMDSPKFAKYAAKGTIKKTYSPPDLEQYMELATEIFSWIQDRRATTVRAITVPNKGQELRYYRNYYLEGEKHPLFYKDIPQLLFEMGRGAFTWIVDSHYETPDLEPEGPYCLTLDLDPTRLIEYSELTQRVGDFWDFCREVGLAPIVLHSGNESFHFRFYVNDFPLDKNPYGILLPKLISWETYYRRRQHELKMQYLRDSMSILTLAYNEWTDLSPVGCNFKKFANPNEVDIIFDNRTGIHQGARVPGSWHVKSGRMCRVMPVDFLPDSEAELHARTSFDFIYDNPHVISKPEFSVTTMERNLKNLLGYTNNYFSSNLSRLIYKEQIFND